MSALPNLLDIQNQNRVVRPDIVINSQPKPYRRFNSLPIPIPPPGGNFIIMNKDRKKIIAKK
jgi:hypothetical protein